MDYYDEVAAKQERSLPLSARVDLVTLAELAKYWVGEGYRLKSVSQLVSWSLDILKEIMINNNAIQPSLDFVKARSLMRDLGLVQHTNDMRSKKKTAAATRFEMMRKSRLNPKVEAPKDWNAVHNSNSVNTSPSISEDEEFEAARAANKAENNSKLLAAKNKSIKGYKDGGFIPITSEEEILQRDKELINTLDNMSLEDMMKGRE